MCKSNGSRFKLKSIFGPLSEIFAVMQVTNYFSTTLAHIPCRAEGNDRSEMVTELLFGEQYQVLENKTKWLKIKCTHDSYEGWIDLRQHDVSKKCEHIAKRVNMVHSKNGRLTLSNGEKEVLLSPGALLSDACHGQIGIDNEIFDLNAEYGIRKISDLPELAKMYLNTPYLWGGRSIWGIDCSGFCQVLFALANISIPRDASQQALIGEEIKLEDIEATDLAFFQNDKGLITHVGMILFDKQIIHASGFVRIDELDSQGIKVASTGDYTHKLHSIKRIRLES